MGGVWSLWQCCRFLLDSILYPQLMMRSYLQTTFNGLLFFAGKVCVNPLVLVVAPGVTNTSFYFFFLMSCENYMEIRCVNGIFTCKVSQILI